MNKATITKLILSGGNRPGCMDAEAYIESTKNDTITTAVVNLTIEVSDDPTLRQLQDRILLEASRNLSPD